MPVTLRENFEDFHDKVVYNLLWESLSSSNTSLKFWLPYAHAGWIDVGLSLKWWVSIISKFLQRGFCTSGPRIWTWILRNELFARWQKGGFPKGWFWRVVFQKGGFGGCSPGTKTGTSLVQVWPFWKLLSGPSLFFFFFSKTPIAKKHYKNRGFSPFFLEKKLRAKILEVIIWSKLAFFKTQSTWTR